MSHRVPCLGFLELYTTPSDEDYEPYAKLGHALALQTLVEVYSYMSWYNYHEW